ncbi:S-adenosyl-L-methionine-dependent methyltransferase [Xylariaceae sp. FL0804]|nr:S-adenosyl-L-methionine-dependent methyltransferase [Xylariaceae sp. FL0804]
MATAGKIRLSAVEETMLGTLHIRAQDAKSACPILNDQHAANVLARLDYDSARGMFNPNPDILRHVNSRARQLDAWCQDFIDRHADEPVAVLHLACGLDSRNLRVRRGANVQWIDLDQPDVVSLRRRLLATPHGDYRIIAGSVNDDDWLEKIPTDRPTCIIAEGLLMYLTPEQAISLIEKLVRFFPTGEFAFDTCGTLVRQFVRFMPFFRGSKATISWSIDSGRRLEAIDSRLKLRQALQWDEFTKDGPMIPLFFGYWTYLLFLFPSYKTSWQMMLFDF